MTDTDLPLCKTSGCGNKSISLSEFCGAHTSNDTYLAAILAELHQHTEHSYCTISDVELIPETEQTFAGHTFSDCTFMNFDLTRFIFRETQFISCDFTDIELTDSRFEDCSFSDCTLDQLNFSECHLVGNNFDQCEWDNSTFHDACTLSHNSFELNKLTQFTLFESPDATGNHFEHCEFILSSINHANFDRSEFLYTGFSKTSIAYSSFRECLFQDVDHDFDQIGPPIACDFFAARVDEEFRQLTEKLYCNYRHEHYLDFVRESIEALLLLEHSNYLSELSYFFNYCLEHDVSIQQYQAHTVALFKRLYQKAVQLNNIEMLGSLIRSFTEMPEEIRQQGFLLPSPTPTMDKHQASLILTFAREDNLTLPVLADINNTLATVEQHLFGDSPNKLAVRQITQGSIIQEFVAHADKILIFAGAFYATTNAVLSLIKQGVEIQKLRAETQKLHMDIDKAKIDTTKAEQTLQKRQEVMLKKLTAYRALLEKQNVIIHQQQHDIDRLLGNLIQSPDEVQRLDKLDRKYPVKEIKVILPD